MPISDRIVYCNRVLSEHIPDVHVIDITVGSIEVINTARDLITSSGAMYISKRDGIRPIIIAIELPFNQAEALNNYNLLRAWAESDMPGPLLLPNQSKGYINCKLSSITDISVSSWYQPILLTFTAYDPYYYGNQQTADVGDEGFTVQGDVPIPFKITYEITSAVTSPAWHIDGTHIIKLSGDVGVGELVIDAKKALITLNGDSIMPQLSAESRFVQLTPGDHTITGDGGIVSWNEGWR